MNSNLKPQTSNLPRRVLVLVGPTASGKTPVSLFIASQLNAEIISADSRQMYKYMDIGTAKPSPEEREQVKHYFVDELLPDQAFNAGEFGWKGREIIEDIFCRKKTPLVVGGSGLYVQSLIDGFFEGPPADQELRKQLYDRLKTDGSEKLLAELIAVDPASASRMLPSNRRRIIRALEVYKLTGVPISELKKNRTEIKFQSAFVGLQWERQQLYRRINERVDRMIEQGLVEEVKTLRDLGYTFDCNALQTTGYKEVFEYLEGKLTYEQMIGLIKRNTRRYAKRQLTWFRQNKRIRWFEVHSEDDFPRVASMICNHFISS
ncbi:MAG: tRNA (adenosine(37)-N6)-dimethylallyltransferase MiaA [Ignavibacteriae bacterium]|nr:tRNA (adenosine(37)-N6)-dimethylallyltransferase MiaA [Ignavibacteriota bacterium]